MHLHGSRGRKKYRKREHMRATGATRPNLDATSTYNTYKLELRLYIPSEHRLWGYLFLWYDRIDTIVMIQ
jgi:hypothetical protein